MITAMHSRRTARHRVTAPSLPSLFAGYHGDMTANTTDAWPDFPMQQWAPTYATLHMWAQIVGKTRLALEPVENHGWQVALYVTTRGLTTSPMPAGAGSVSVDFDFVAHRLAIRSSAGAEWFTPLAPRSVADFYQDYLGGLRRFGL